MDKPRWLEDEPELEKLLHRFLDKLDNQPLSERKQALRLKVDRKILPNLFRHDEQSDHEWHMLQTLADQFRLFDIKQARKSGLYEADFNNASLVFNPEAEDLLRGWLQRPQTRSYALQWRKAIYKNAAFFMDGGLALASRPARISALSAEQVVDGFVNLAKYIDKDLSLRQLSSLCFRGHSKFLDAREDVLMALYSEVNIRPRPVLANVFLPPVIQGVIFVENHDTYVNACRRGYEDMKDLAVVYVSGFMLSAKRIRGEAGVSLHYFSQSDRNETQRFERWWFEKEIQTWGVYFWGDLDFSGMNILKALRHRFGDVKAWRAGYEPMLKQIQAGYGHEASSAGKDEQLDPDHTGCAYSDEVLLPTLRKTRLFLDQESVVDI